MTQEFAKIISTLIVFITFCLILIWIGYSIEDVDSTYYPALGTVIICYIGVGDLAFTVQRVEVPASRRIEGGGVDLLWGIKHYYWIMWWPRIIKMR